MEFSSERMCMPRMSHRPVHNCYMRRKSSVTKTKSEPKAFSLHYWWQIRKLHNNNFLLMGFVLCVFLICFLGQSKLRQHYYAISYIYFSEPFLLVFLFLLCLYKQLCFTARREMVIVQTVKYLFITRCYYNTGAGQVVVRGLIYTPLA